MESLGPGELKHGTTQVFLLLFFITYRLTSGNPLGIHRPGETQAWNQPGWPTGGAQAWRSGGHDKGPSSEACYLGIRLISLTMAF